MTHICVGNLTITVSDNGLSPNRRLAITWTNDEILLIGPLGTNFSEFLIKIHTFSLKKMHLKTSSARWWPFCLGLNVIKNRMNETRWFPLFTQPYTCLVTFHMIIPAKLVCCLHQRQRQYISVMLVNLRNEIIIRAILIYILNIFCWSWTKNNKNNVWRSFQSADSS